MFYLIYYNFIFTLNLIKLIIITSRNFKNLLKLNEKYYFIINQFIIS